MSTERVYAIDRVAEGSTVLIGDDGDIVTVDTAVLPPGTGEGSVLRVPLGDDGEPRWTGAFVDREETDRRLADARQRLERLKRRDPGGDLKL